jgi:hypothetical protein
MGSSNFWWKITNINNVFHFLFYQYFQTTLNVFKKWMTLMHGNTGHFMEAWHTKSKIRVPGTPEKWLTALHTLRWTCYAKNWLALEKVTFYGFKTSIIHFFHSETEKDKTEISCLKVSSVLIRKGILRVVHDFDLWKIWI